MFDRDDDVDVGIAEANNRDDVNQRRDIIIILTYTLTLECTEM